MDLNKNNLKKILGIITFTLLLSALLIHVEAVKSYLAFLWGIAYPFVMGGVIAFILNIPMTLIEKKVFRVDLAAGNVSQPQLAEEPESEAELSSQRADKIRYKLARPISLLLSILFVFAILTVVLVVVIPQLGKTIDSIGEGMTAFLPKAQAWLEEIFGDSKRS